MGNIIYWNNPQTDLQLQSNIVEIHKLCECIECHKYEAFEEILNTKSSKTPILLCVFICPYLNRDSLNCKLEHIGYKCINSIEEAKDIYDSKYAVFVDYDETEHVLKLKDMYNILVLNINQDMCLLKKYISRCFKNDAELKQYMKQRGEEY